MANRRERPFLGTLRCGSAAERLFTVPLEGAVPGNGARIDHFPGAVLGAHEETSLSSAGAYCLLNYSSRNARNTFQAV